MYSYDASNAFAEQNIPTKIIPDSAIGAALEKVDFVLTGAEAVVESGGIINRVKKYFICLHHQNLF